jgi:mRNA interferase HigB
MEVSRGRSEAYVVHVISRSRLRSFVRKHSDAATALYGWFKIASKARWTTIHDVREDYPQADPVGSCVVFNAGGNKYRLITRIIYAARPDPAGKPVFGGRVYVLHVLTHAEYDEEKWKADCDC